MDEIFFIFSCCEYMRVKRYIGGFEMRTIYSPPKKIIPGPRCLIHPPSVRIKIFLLPPYGGAALRQFNRSWEMGALICICRETRNINA